MEDSNKIKTLTGYVNKSISYAKKCEGVCPYCKNDDVNSIGSETDDTGISYFFKCNDCNNEFTEVCSMVYVYTIYEKSRQKKINIKKWGDLLNNKK